MLGVLILQWIRQSEREARRVDRQLDREEAASASKDQKNPAEGTDEIRRAGASPTGG